MARWSDTVLRTAYTWTGSTEDAQDICQTVLLKRLTYPESFQEDRLERAWLLRVTANCAKSLAASPWRKRHVALEDIYAYDQPEESGLDAALAQLPAKYRAVIHLYYYEGYDTEETARILGRKPSTVRAQLTRARQALARLLKEDL